MSKDLRTYLEQIRDRILTIGKPVDPVTQMGGICTLVEQPIAFENVTGYPGWKVVDRLFATRDLVALAAGVSPGKLVPELSERWLRPPRRPAVRVATAPVKERVLTGRDADVNRIPVALSSPGDSGRFFSGAHLVSVNPLTGDQNAAFCRVEIKPDGLLSAGLYRPDTLRNVALHKEQGRTTMPVALCIGHHPAYDLCAAVSFHHPGFSEHELATNLLDEPVELTTGETVDLAVPAGMEVVVEGEMDLTRHVPNGPFGEYTVHYGYDARGYGIRVTGILMRGDAIYRHLNSTRFTDHQVLTGTGHSVQIFTDLARKGHDVRDVTFPPYGGRLLMFVKAVPRYDGEVRDMFLTASARNSMAKFTIFVDDDVDLDDPRDVFHVLATNADPVLNVMTLDGLPSNVLNPTARHKENPYTCVSGKMLIDATRGSTMGSPERRQHMERIGFWPGIDLKDFV